MPRARLTLLIAIAALASLPAAARAETFCVNAPPGCSGTMTNFAQALSDADDGDSIRLGPADYSGPFTAAGAVTIEGSGRDTRLTGPGPVLTATDDATLHRVRMTPTSNAAVEADQSDVTVEDVLVEVPSGVSGLRALSGAGSASLLARNVTVIGASGAVDGVGAQGGTASVTVHSSYVHGFNTDIAATAPATATVSHSDFTTAGLGVTQGAGNQDSADPLFADPPALDFRLRAGSPLVDRGNPAALAAGESNADLAGSPRVMDGDGDCGARRDIGAFEFVAPATVARATAPGSAYAGQAVTLSAAGSCDADPAVTPTYRWLFSDGATAEGATVTHAFADPGTRAATVTVLGGGGRGAQATAVVNVVPLPVAPPRVVPRADVVISGRQVKMTPGGVINVRLGCLAAVADRCVGSITLRTASAFRIRENGPFRRYVLGSERFSIPGTRAKIVNVRVPLAARRLIIRRRLVLVNIGARFRAATVRASSSGQVIAVRAPVLRRARRR